MKRRGLRKKRTKSRKTFIYLNDDQTGFLNVDLVVSAAKSLESIAAALGDNVSIHYVGSVGPRVFQVRFSLYDPKDADTAIRKLVKVIDALPRAARRQWNTARERLFDIGFQAGLKPHCAEFDISEETAAAIKRVRGSIKITIYATESGRLEPAVRRAQRRSLEPESW